MANSNTFKVGLCLAGAISAGAYTAGVIDYLIEALDEWQKRKDSGDADIPMHNVEIPIIGGASAGGMTGIIASSVLSDKFKPVSEIKGNVLRTIPENKLYHSWVDLVDDDMLKVLLNTDDIVEGEIKSGLNSEFIDKIANRLLEESTGEIYERRYISKNLKVFTTLSNLKGMDFNVTFKSHSSKDSSYIVTNHSDFACFMLAQEESDYKNDGWIPLNFRKKLNSDIAANAAMGTGAFPIGLKARALARDSKYLNELDWLDYITKDAKNPFSPGLYESINIDGGMINNEPFENVRKVLTGITEQDDFNDFQSYDRFKSTILMIDPFPSQTSELNPSTELKSVIGNTLGALIDQSRIKPSNLIDTNGSNRAGQYLIEPVRYEKTESGEKSIDGSRAIACGSLGGFGGFFSKEFRIHDYFLGRANCEQFLREYFTIPVDHTNEIFLNGYADVTDKKPYTAKNGGLQIIPIFAPRKERLYMPAFSNGKIWPTITEDYVKSYRKMLKSRVEKILLNISKYSKMERFLIWVGAKVVLNGKIADAILDTTIEAFKKNNLLENK